MKCPFKRISEDSRDFFAIETQRTERACEEEMNFCELRDYMTKNTSKNLIYFFVKTGTLYQDLRTPPFIPCKRAGLLSSCKTCPSRLRSTCGVPVIERSRDDTHPQNLTTLPASGGKRRNALLRTSLRLRGDWGGVLRKS
ncbi:hypothetical protein U27_04020 [Candidatus Vecturithrix granuli]|uniref:Uncharacterized protein n=1 Tax=Vecturithrix granuli TaxID=1499967 RepID=A0A081BXK1_VECG1|nr:hypothetical protein U27_04020 [Candidatus Vecturithrix granuli]